VVDRSFSLVEGFLPLLPSTAFLDLHGHRHRKIGRYNMIDTFSLQESLEVN